MRKLIVIIALFMGLSACEEKEISLFPSFEESALVNIKTVDGSFEESATIYSSAIYNAVNEAVDGNGDIERIVIEGIWFELTPKAKNEADKVFLDLKIKSWESGVYLSILDDLEVDIKKGKVNFIKYLKVEGILELKKQITAMALGTAMDDVNFEIEGEVVKKDINGDQIPDTPILDVDLEVFVSGTVVYKSTI